MVKREFNSRHSRNLLSGNLALINQLKNKKMKLSVTATHWRPGDRPPAAGLLVIRHGPRDKKDQPPILAELTAAGRRECKRLGAMLTPHRPCAIFASPFPRCIDTGRCIAAGAQWELPVRGSRLLGDPGPFVQPEQIAKSKDPRIIAARESHDWEPLLRRHARGEHIPGVTPRDQGARQFCEQLFAAQTGGYLLCISHHSIIAAVMAAFGLQSDPWPDFLEGAVLQLTTQAR